MATIEELRSQARAAGIVNFGRMDKEQLQAAIAAGSPSPSSSPPPALPPTSGSTVRSPAAGPTEGTTRVPCGGCVGKGVPVKSGGYLCNICGREWEVTDGD